MESKASVAAVPESNPPPSGLSSSLIPVRAVPSYDSDTEFVTETNGLNSDLDNSDGLDSGNDKGGSGSSSNSSSSGGSSDSSSGSGGSSKSDDGEEDEEDDGGFVSGEEEFVAAENPTDEDEVDETYVEAVDTSVIPVAKVSSDREDDDDENEADDVDVDESTKARGFEVDEIGELGGSFGGGVELGSDSVVSGVGEHSGDGPVVYENVEGVVELKKDTDVDDIVEDKGEKPVVEEKDVAVIETASPEAMVTGSEAAGKIDIGGAGEPSGLKLLLEELSAPVKSNLSESGGVEKVSADNLVAKAGLEVQLVEAGDVSRVEEVSNGGTENLSESGGVEQVSADNLVAKAGLEEQLVEAGDVSRVEEVSNGGTDQEDTAEKPIAEAGMSEQFKSYMSELVGGTADVGDATDDDDDDKTASEDESENISLPVNDSKTVNVEDEISSETVREVDEPEGDKLAPEGDAIVENLHADIPEPGADVVGDSVKKALVMEPAVDNGFDVGAHDIEEPTDLKTSGAEKDETEDTVTIPGSASPKAAQDDAPLDGEEKLATVDEPESDADALKKEAVILSSRDVDSNGGEIEGVDTISQSSETDSEKFLEAEDEISQLLDQDGEIEGDSDTEGMIFGGSEAARKFMEELEKGSGAESAHELSERIDGQIVTDSDEEEAGTDEEGDGNELFDSAALAALLKAATGGGSDGGNITITSPNGSRLFSVERPAGLGSSLRSVKPPTARPNGSSLFTPSQLTSTRGESETVLTDEDKKKLELIQQLRVKFLRIVQRLGQSGEDNVVAQVLYRLSLIAGRPTSPFFSLEVAKETAMALEAGEEKSDLDFSLNILVLGKAGVGKSATINSIFGEEKTSTDAFDFATTTVKEITGMVDGVKVRVFDTPGLKSSQMEQAANQKILGRVKKFTKKCPPDIVLYVDRLDTQTRDLNDLPLLRSITASLGPSIWRSAIVTLTHGSSAPPDGSSGNPLSYEVYVAQRSHVVQQSIGQAVGDMRLMNPSLMNPVSLVENHQSCRKNRDGQKVLPNGQTWRPQLLLLCYSMKILSDANALSKPQEAFDHRKLFGFRSRSPPLPYLLSWLLQSRTHPKLPSDQGADMGDSDIDLDDFSDSEAEDGEDEYDQLPPFKPLRKAQLEKLSKEQKKAYLEEYDYRVKLLQKKQWREELKRMRESKKRGNAVSPDEFGYNGDDMEQEDGGPATVPVALPDMALPPSFDSDNPAYRYRFLEPTSQLLMRPVLDTHGWDHDCGYDGVNLEQTLAIASRFPAAVTVQVTKDKKEFNIHLDSSVAAKHGENNSSMAGFDIQNVGKQLAYILRGETKLKALKRNTTSAGFSVTFLGENIATGLKLEDQLTLGKRLVLVGSTGTVRSQSDAAYGANLEVRLRESDFPIGQDQFTLGLSLVKWRGDLALGANLQSQFSVGRASKVAVRVGLNNKLSGQITVRTTSSDQLQIALMGLVPVVMTIYKTLWPGAGENNSIY